MVASPFSRPLGETDAPAPVRAKEWVWERGEGEESLRPVGACGCYNPSPQSSPLIQGERRGVAGGVGSHAVPTELGLILAQTDKHVASNGALHGLFTKASY